MKLHLLLFLLLIASCRNAKPVDNITAPDSQYANSKPDIAITDSRSDSVKLRSEDASILNEDASKKPGLLARIFKRDSPKKVKLKHVTIIHQTAGGNIEAVTTDAPKKTISKSKPVEKLKGQNAVKGDGVTATADKSDKSLMWVIIALVVAAGAYLYFKKT